MSRSVFTLLSSMNEKFTLSLQNMRARYTRDQSPILHASRRISSIDFLIDDFFGHLKQMNLKKAGQLYSKEFLKLTQSSSHVHEKKRQTLKTLYDGLRDHPIESYEVLMQYKVPFSDLGVDQVLVYTKLKSVSIERYIAIWIKRSVYGQSSWRVDDVYMHDAYSTLSLSVEHAYPANTNFYTLRGQLVSDSILTALFFTRLFADSYDVYSEQRILSDKQRCNVDFVNCVQSNIQELITSLCHRSVHQSLHMVSPQLRECINAFKEACTREQTLDHETPLSEDYHLLALYQLPARFEGQTRVLVHLYIPSIKTYFSVWFTRSASRGLTWSLEDFYMHQFGKIKPRAYADKDYCQMRFRTIKTRVFYIPDLIGEHILNTPLWG